MEPAEHEIERDIDWPTCTAGARCIGIRIHSDKPCLAHLDEDGLKVALDLLGQEGVLDARGVRFSAVLLRQVLSALPTSDAKQPTFKGDARFDRATFIGDAWFSKVIFKGDATFQKATFMGDAWFTAATFERDALFDGAAFKGDARFGWAASQPLKIDATTFDRAGGFREATFMGDGRFAGATFERDTLFGGAIFTGVADFKRAIFKGDAWFGFATFKHWADFDLATFEHDAGFFGATFEKYATFNTVTFTGDAGFSEATFKGAARFDTANLKGDAWFSNVTCDLVASFSGGTFEQARRLGPMQARESVELNDAIFRQRIQIDIAAARLDCRRTRFLEGGHLRVRWARILLQDADFAAPSILTTAPRSTAPDEQWFEPYWQQKTRPPRPGGQPWVASLQRADVAGLTMGDVDLRACRFAGAHNLDLLRLESPKAFAGTPGWKAVESGWAWPPLWRWTRRQVLAEEHAWRASHERGIRQAGWHRGESWTPDNSHWVAITPHPARPPGRRSRQVARALGDARRMPRRLALLRQLRAIHRRDRREELRQRREQAREIANLYRMLRKGREDNKDEPGAADFYYGEMEMRRKAGPPSAERLILWLYWLVSGYALRAWRAMVATLVVLAVFAALMVAVGFQHRANSQATAATTATGATPARPIQPPDTSLPAALIYGARTAIGLSRDTQPRLTRWGDVLQITVRITVPVLLGLAVLSIRGRVKR